jgi:hypothetical protein
MVAVYHAGRRLGGNGRRVRAFSGFVTVRVPL